MSKKYYVYTHSYMDGSVFYVGKGTGRRAYNKRKGKAWEKPYVVEIQITNLSEKDALNCEAVLIRHYGFENLANKKKESVKENVSLKHYKTLQHKYDLEWLEKNKHTFTKKDSFVKEQLDIIEWAKEFSVEVQKTLSLL